jgi:hypothetical protein
VKAGIEAAHPGIWEKYEFGREPRTYTFQETRTVTWPARRARPDRQSVAAGPRSTAEPVPQDMVVLGFDGDYAGPEIQSEHHDGLYILDERVVSLNFYFRILDWGLSVRLPITGEIYAAGPIAEGSTVSLPTWLRGVDLTDEQYAAVGLPGESGSEAYFHRYALESCLSYYVIIIWEDEPPWCGGPPLDPPRSDFTPPIGGNSPVALPTLDVEVGNYHGVIGVDHELVSSAKASGVTATWSVQGGGIGSDWMNFPDLSSQPLGPVIALDGPARLDIALEGLRYHFSEFTVSPRVKYWASVYVNEWPIFIDWDPSWTQDLGTYHLRDFVGYETDAVEMYSGEGYGGSTGPTASIEVTNVAPIPRVEVDGAQRVSLNGVETMVGRVGYALTFTGTSFDRGRDAQTLQWLWGDNAAPDAPELFLSPAWPMPNVATDVRNHVFDRGAVYQVKLITSDDDSASATAQMPLIVLGNDAMIRIADDWQLEIGRTGSAVDPQVIAGYLAVVARASAVFDEVTDVTRAGGAFHVINLGRKPQGPPLPLPALYRPAGSALYQVPDPTSGTAPTTINELLGKRTDLLEQQNRVLDRELLAAWLNYASGAIGGSRLVDTNTDGTPDTPFLDVLTMAERVRLDPSSSVAALKDQTLRVRQAVAQLAVRI